MEMQIAIGFMDETSALGLVPTQKRAVLSEGTIFTVSRVHYLHRREVGAQRPLPRRGRGLCRGSGRC